MNSDTAGRKLRVPQRILQGAITDAQVASALSPLPEESWLRQFVLHGSRQVPSPTIYHVATGLTLLALSSPPSLVIRDVFIRRVYANFWGLICGPSRVSLKTTALDVGLNMLLDHAPHLRAEDPASEEALVKGLSFQQTCALVYPEFGSFLANTTAQGGNYRGKIRDSLTDLYDCTPIRRRKVKSSVTVDHPRLSLLGACTPQHLEDHTTRLDWTGGWMSRFFLTLGVATRDMGRPIPDEELAAWLVREFLAREAIKGGHGPCVGMEAAAWDRWDTWRRRIQQEALDAPPRLGGPINGSMLHATKIALLLSWDCGLAWDTAPWQISDMVMDVAIRLAELHKSTAVVLTESIAPTPEARELLASLNAVAFEWTPLGQVLTDHPVGKRKCLMLLDTLIERGQVEGVKQNGKRFYRRVAKVALPQFDTACSVEPIGVWSPETQATPPAVAAGGTVLPFVPTRRFGPDAD